nr:hypothetical protein [Tanacetum cinerariifolium]
MFKCDLDRDPFNSVLRDEETLYVQAFNDAVLLEERFLKQKAKVDWLRDGDANTAYFHKSVKSRVSRSRIDVVMDSEGVIYENEKVAEALVAHYEMFLGQHRTVIPLCASNLFQNRLDDVAAIEMIREVSDQEIKDAIFSMGNDKSSGPDGYTAAFLKRHRGPPRCAFKVDIQKAYDTVDWNFLKDILLGFGFHDRLGDTSSTKVIMKALDEFKNVSGLTPSLPKSKAYFCNVLNHVKFSILQILPFEEDRLSVEYLGVPLVSSRLIIRDCKELIEKKLIINKESLWVQWIHAYKIHGRNFWEIPIRGNMTCGWRKGGFNHATTLTEVIVDGHFIWPNEWHSSFPDLNSIVVPILRIGVRDKPEWRNLDGVWRKVRVMAGLPSANPSMDSIIHDILPFANRKSSKSVCSKLVLAAFAYFIWQERNNCLFRNERKSVDQVVECILNSVRLKLVSCRWKKSKAALSVLNLWNLNSIVLEG